MSKFKVIHEREVCIGCCACESISPDFWKLNDDNKVDLIGAKKEEDSFILNLDDIDNLVESAESCPVECIHIEEDGKRKI